MANETKLINAGNLKAVAQGIYTKSQANLAAEAARVNGIIGEAAVEGKEATGLRKEIADADKANADAIAKEAQDRADAIKEAVTFENGITTINTLGGIAPGTNLDGKTVNEILDMLLFPYVQPTISGSSNKTTSAQGSTSTTLEKGDSLKFTSLTAKVTRKSKDITKVEFLVDSSVVATVTEGVEKGGSFSHTFASPIEVKTNVAANKFKVRATDTAGKTVSADAGTAITFVYPYYVGICDEGATIDEALVEGLTKKVVGKNGYKDHTVTTNNQRVVFAYPQAYGNLKSVIDPNNFDVTGTFTKHEVNVTGLDGTKHVYNVYVNAASTVSNFKFTFTIN